MEMRELKNVEMRELRLAQNAGSPRAKEHGDARAPSRAE